MRSFLWRVRTNQRNSHESSPKCVERRYNLRGGGISSLPTPQLILGTPPHYPYNSRKDAQAISACFRHCHWLHSKNKKDFHISMKLRACFVLTQQRLLYQLKFSSILYQLGLYCVTTTIRSPPKPQKWVVQRRTTWMLLVDLDRLSQTHLTSLGGRCG